MGLCRKEIFSSKPSSHVGFTPLPLEGKLGARVSFDSVTAELPRDFCSCSFWLSLSLLPASNPASIFFSISLTSAGEEAGSVLGTSPEKIREEKRKKQRMIRQIDTKK
jgi:hypothetical protein